MMYGSDFLSTACIWAYIGRILACIHKWEFLGMLDFKKNRKKQWKLTAFCYKIKVSMLSNLGVWSSPEHDELLNTFKCVFLTFILLKILSALIWAAWHSPALERWPLTLHAWPGQGHDCQFGVLQTIYTSGHWTVTCKLRSHRSVEKQLAFKENILS